MEIGLKRDIYQDLLAWKNSGSEKVLELEGARQVGKTYILDKFARENYKKYLYINMLQISGRDFLRCIHKAEEWEPGQPRPEQPLYDAFLLYDSSFTDTKDTVVVIDEVQESAEIYSCIREFAREFASSFIVTGSYLGKTLEKEYFLPAGDVETLVLEPLSFEEFLMAVGKRSIYENVDLYGGSSHSDYDELKKWYDLYLQIGGYPAVIKNYVENREINSCLNILDGIIDIFIRESTRYFKDIIEINMFEQILPAVA